MAPRWKAMVKTRLRAGAPAGISEIAADREEFLGPALDQIVGR